MSRFILPAATLGVLGSGQLGRMFAMAARRLGYRVHTFSPDSDTPTGQVADLEITADYRDLDALRKFAQGVQAVTFEFENIPVESVRAVAEFVPVHPAGAVLHITQHRLREKSFLSENGFPVAPWYPVKNLAELQTAQAAINAAAVLKTAGFGYDGKGQAKILSAADCPSAWEKMHGAEAVLEAFVDFEREISVIAARGHDGAFVHYGALDNSHARHILDLTIAPAAIPPALAREAVDLARAVLEKLGVVGVMCVEMFVTREGKIVINELAPRPHNSGHFSIDACATSQFEQQVRALCGLPLGDPALIRPAAMVNLLGDLWAKGEPDWAAALALPGVRLHLYGKDEARPGRKMGHLTVLAETGAKAGQIALAARAALTRK